MKVNVLIVDDSPILRKSIRRAVLMAGVEEDRISEAGNGLEALESIRANEPDIVLLDINMPVMDGEEFMVEVDNAGCYDQMAVIIVSTETNAKRLIRLGSLGAKGRLKKPFEPEDLRAIIARQLKDKVLRMERLEQDPMSQKVMDTLETMFFTSVEASPEPVQDFDWHVGIEVLGPVDRTEVVISAAEGFAVELASSMLGVAVEDVDAEDEGLQGLQELANVVCGEVIELLGGENERISCSIPLPVEEPKGSGFLELEFLSTEGQPLRVTVLDRSSY